MADVLSAELDRYVHAAMARRWAWGEVDCFLFVADWVERATGLDPAGVWRGAYTTEREARRLMKRHGGPLALAARGLAAAGCAATTAPGRGDVALVRVPLKEWRGRLIVVPVGAICLRGGLWMVRVRDGLVFRNFGVLQAWGVPHGGRGRCAAAGR